MHAAFEQLTANTVHLLDLTFEIFMISFVLALAFMIVTIQLVAAHLLGVTLLHFCHLRFGTAGLDVWNLL